MALLRSISKGKWAVQDWLKEGDAPADALYDLRVTDNRLSVWAIDADQENLTVVLTAFAANRDYLDKIDYVLLGEEVLPSIPIKCEQVEGNTPHKTANAAHRALVELTARQVAELAETIMALPRKRVSEKQIKQFLTEALQAGALDRALIKEGLLSAIESS